MEKVITANNYGFDRILLLTNKKNLIQLVHRSKTPAWHDRSLIADMDILYQSGNDRNEQALSILSRWTEADAVITTEIFFKGAKLDIKKFLS